MRNTFLPFFSIARKLHRPIWVVSFFALTGLSAHAQMGVPNAPQVAQTAAPTVATGEGTGVKSGLPANIDLGNVGPIRKGVVAGESSGVAKMIGEAGAEGEIAAASSSAAINRNAVAKGANVDGPTEFQQFVSQSTGRLLPIYGAKLFGEGAFEPIQAVQVPDGYIVGPGDELLVKIFGSFEYVGRLVVDRDGSVALPKVGLVKVAGLRYSQMETALSRAAGEIFKNFQLSVSMGRLRSVEIYVLGQARNPGRRVVSSLSTLINALFETGGPSVQGSMRAIELRRAGRVVTRLDLYDFISRGDNQADRPLEPGDIIYIPPVGPQVAILGSVNESAIFELPASASPTLQSVLALNGGVSALATPHQLQIERVNPAQTPARRVQNIALDKEGLATVLQSGDVISVYPISPQFANAVTLQGSVSSPMRVPYREGQRISDLVVNNSFLVPVSYWLRVNSGALISGIDKPEVNLEYATVQRLDPVRLRTETLSFHLAKALMGDPSENLLLKPGDLVRVYGASEMTQDAIDSVSLETTFLDGPGIRRSVWREGSRVNTVIPDLRWLQEQVLRKARGAGVIDSIGEFGRGALQAGSSSTKRLSVSDLHEVNLEYADVRRLDPVTLEVKLITFNLAKALAGDVSQNIELKKGDRISLYTKREVPVPVARRTRIVKILGEVAVPGTYQVGANETLTDIVRRAGGPTKQAYMFGARFIRESTKLEQKKNLAAYISALEAELINLRTATAQNQTTQDLQRQEAVIAAQRQAIERLRSTEVTGRVALDLDETQAQPELPSLALEDGDILEIPNRSDFITIVGSVDIPNAMIHRPGLSARDYLERAGLRPNADLENVAILKADGTLKTGHTISGRLSWFGGMSRQDFFAQSLSPGDAILVPEKLDRTTGYTAFITAAKDWTQLIYQFGLGIAAFKALN